MLVTGMKAEIQLLEERPLGLVGWLDSKMLDWVIKYGGLAMTDDEDAATALRKSKLWDPDSHHVETINRSPPPIFMGYGVRRMSHQPTLETVPEEPEEAEE